MGNTEAKTKENFLYAIMTNKEGEVNKMLTEHPKLVNTKLISDMTNPMCRASYLGYQKIITLLLSKGGDIDCRSSDGRSPLMWATFRNNTKVMEYLLEMGAPIDSKDNTDSNAMDLAIIMMNY